MSAHLTDKQIERYRSRSFAAEELLAASGHLAACEACRARIASPVELRAAVDRVRAALDFRHPAYEEMAAHVDGQESGFVESHVRECDQCAADLHELRRLQEEIGSGQARRRWRFRLPAAIFVAAATACAAILMVLRVPRTPPITARVDAPAPANAIHDGNRVFSIAAGGNIAGMEALPAADRAQIEQALAAQRIEPPPVVAQLAGKRGVLLGSAPATSALELLEPLSTVVESQRPVFRWKPLPGAEYQVSVYDAGYSVAAAGDWIRAAEWQPARDLRRGSRYSWQVKVRRNGEEFAVPAPPLPEARFQVLGAPEEDDLALIRREWGDSHLVLGIRYARAGLLDDAARELRALDRDNPGSPVTAALLASLEQMRRSK